MDESVKSFWNKTTEELTVKDQLIMVAAVPIVMVGSLVVVGAGVGIYTKVTSKFRKKPSKTVLIEKTEED